MQKHNNFNDWLSGFVFLCLFLYVFIADVIMKLQISGSTQCWTILGTVIGYIFRGAALKKLNPNNGSGSLEISAELETKKDSES